MTLEKTCDHPDIIVLDEVCLYCKSCGQIKRDLTLEEIEIWQQGVEFGKQSVKMQEEKTLKQIKEMLDER